MILVLKEIYKFCFYYICVKNDPRSDHLPLLGSPWKIIAILTGYFYIIKYKGPELMKNREPFELKYIMMFYNAFQVVSNFSLGTYVVYKLLFVYNIDFSCLTSKYDNSIQALDELMVTYLYFLLKVLDLLDTIFFVLRKKYNQISFLHVYHHTIMCVAGYLATSYYPGGHGGIMGLVNTFVHTFMYSYYFFTSFNLTTNVVWWKKYITQVQILQFAILVVHFIRPIYNGNCNYPFFIIWSCLIQNVFMLALFTDFYIRTYIRKPIKKIN